MKLITTLLLSALIAPALTGCSQSGKAPDAKATTKTYEIETKEIPYTYGKTKMIGYLAKPKTNEKRPGVLVVHEWWGQSEYPRQRAEMLAKQGYVAFAVDMYGDRKVLDHPKDAGAFAKKTMSNIKDTEGKFMSALSTLQSQESVDSERIAALGYCYGGGLVLEMARRGAPLDLVFVYHGSLVGQSKATDEKFQGQVFVFNGEADPMVTKEQVEAFGEEMNDAGVDYRFYSYKEAKHAFTNPNATEYGKKFNLPLAYNQEADKDSWEKTLEALDKL